MRILLTGGCGFLGHHIVEHLLRETDAKIIVLDKMTYASSGLDRMREVLAGNEGILGKPDGDHRNWRLRILGCDISRPMPAGVTQEIGEIDYVIHAAAETHVDNSIVDPLPFLESNVMGTHHLLWWARDVPSIKRLFLISTDEVYGPADWDSPGNKETDTYRPANPYAAAKAGGEMVAFAYANTYKLPITIVNTMNLYGERQHPEKFIPKVIRSAMRGDVVPIHSDPGMTRSGTRFYIHCRNFANALSFLVHGGPPNGPRVASMHLPMKIHVAGEKEISNLELAQTIARFVGKKLHYEMVDFHSSRPGHDLRYALDDSKIRDMGWKQPLDIEQSLERTVRWYLDNPKWLGL